MSVMNRKMFNRNARNRLNSMGGIASFQPGGPVVANPNIFSTNPKSKYFQPPHIFFPIYQYIILIEYILVFETQ